MKVIIRESAYADLERIYAWIAQDSPRNAISVVRRIDDAIEDKLAYFPFDGSARESARHPRGARARPALHHRVPGCRRRRRVDGPDNFPRGPRPLVPLA